MMNEERPLSLEKQTENGTPAPFPAGAPYAVYYNPPRIAPKPVYSENDRRFAIAAAVLGYIVMKTYIECVDRSGLGLMATVASLCVTVFNFFYCRSLGMSGCKTTKVLFAANMLLSWVFLFCDNIAVVSISAAVIFAGNVYYSYAAYREGSRSVVHTAFRAFFISPFHHYGALFESIFKKPEGARKSDSREKLRRILPVIIGAALSLPLCIVVASLLGSADEAFGSLFSFSLIDILKWIEKHIISNIFIVLFSIPLSMYIFAAPYSRSYKMRNEDKLEKQKRPDIHVIPQSMCAAFLVPLALMYVIFTGLQVIHVFTASVLNDPDFTYAEYARSGFFQLCAVALINLAVISVIMFFAKKKKGSVLRIFVVIFCLLTHCLILTALSKMLLYIDIYGMTPKRVNTSVFMIYLFVMFAVLIAKQFKESLSFTKTGYCLAAAVLIAMAFIPVDRLIAEYNVEHYRSGDISWMGYSAMQELDATAAPVFAQISRDDGMQAFNDAGRYFNEKKSLTDVYGKMTAWDLNIPRIIAVRASESFDRR